MEQFCEQHGFTFHSCGRGKWGAYPYYSFGDVEYTPFNGIVKIVGRYGTYQGTVESVDHFLELLRALRIDVTKLNNPEQAHQNAQLKMERKMALANRVAKQIQIKYGFRPEKCLNMATRGKWWNRINHLSQISHRIVDNITAETQEEIESGAID